MSEKELGLNPGSNKCQSYDQELDLSPLSLLLVYKDLRTGPPHSLDCSTSKSEHQQLFLSTSTLTSCYVHMPTTVCDPLTLEASAVVWILFIARNRN